MPAASLKLLAQARAFLRSHALPALAPHALSPVSVPAAPAQAAEQDAAQDEQAQRLPVLQRRCTEQLRYERVPQQHHREPEQREVFVAQELDGVSFRELARRTGVSINTLLSRKRYAVRFLRTRLQAAWDEWLTR